MYFIDGYNLLFALQESSRSLLSQREHLIQFLQQLFTQHRWQGLLVFDGTIRADEESGRSYPSPLEVVYTSKAQSADDYIVECIAFSKYPKKITVITNDRRLTANAHSLGAKTMPTKRFIEHLMIRKQKPLVNLEKDPIAETKHQIERLRKIFEEEGN
ncbi:MAG: NYN domain-containing protein [Chlamydiia bacterium]|nr:NYN domain-containing protein [Chlamydiia bacterium]